LSGISAAEKLQPQAKCLTESSFLVEGRDGYDETKHLESSCTLSVTFTHDMVDTNLNPSWCYACARRK